MMRLNEIERVDAALSTIHISPIQCSISHCHGKQLMDTPQMPAPIITTTDPISGTFLEKFVKTKMSKRVQDLLYWGVDQDSLNLNNYWVPLS